MGKPAEKVLLFQFSNDAAERIKAVLKKLSIDVRVLPEESMSQRLGYLLGLRGFHETPPDEGGDFDFDSEVMILHHIKGKRLDRVLDAMKKAGIPHIRYKAVVTPFNTLWTLGRLCETMRREHSALAEAGEMNKS